MNHFLLISFSFLTGISAGILICIYRYPNWKFKKMYTVYKSMSKGKRKWVHVLDFADHTNHEIVKPNCDTLYSFVFINLSKGTHRLLIPKVENLYFSISFLRENTDVLHHINKRNYGEKVSFTLSNKKNDVNSIYLNANLCWAIARFGVKSNKEISKVNAYQQKLKIELIDEID